MRITSACIYTLNIPFVERFSHSLSDRDHSDSIVVRVTTDSGVSGFGEGVPRPYVTGETRESCVEHLKSVVLPALLGAELDGIDLKGALAGVDALLAEPTSEGTVIWNASRCAAELAMIDGLFRSHRRSVNEALPPTSQTVAYSAVITAGSTAKVEKIAHRCKAAGFSHVKMKVSGSEDAERVAAVRCIFGPAVSIRLDANAAFDLKTAVQFLKSVEEYDIECIEQPIPRNDSGELAKLRSLSPIPVMADESIVTIQDARRLIEEEAVDYFNLRISKCGGIHNTLAIFDCAKAAGIGIQLGCQVGETAILSAAGRHLAAHWEGLRFIEGSYSTHLLAEDISEESILFGPGGHAPLLTGDGLGITVCEGVLDKYADHKISVC